MDFIDKLKQRYGSASLLMRFIYINIAVFVVLRVTGLVSFLLTGSGDSFVQWVELPSSLLMLMQRPWTIITYMFSHYGLLHILFNMLWLFWLGRIFLDCFTPRQLGGLYVLGGLGGAALFVLAYNLLPSLASQQAMLIGASASVMAIVIAIAVYRPGYQVGLLFIGPVSLKWIAIVTVFLDLISIEGANAGGHIAHLGGMLVGLWFALGIKRGHDITSWINRAIDAVVSLFKNKKSDAMRQPVGGKRYKYHQSQPEKSSKNASSNNTRDEARLDEILGKLKRSGYDALTDEEKEFLFNASRKRF